MNCSRLLSAAALFAICFGYDEVDTNPNPGPQSPYVAFVTRRLRSVSQRLEALEDGIDRVEQRVQGMAADKLEQRLVAIEEVLARIEAALVEATAAR